MNIKEGLGYQRLSPIEKKAYSIFCNNFSVFSSTIDISNIDRSIDIMKVLQVVLSDNPEIIYFNKTQIKITTSLFGRKQAILIGCPTLSQIMQLNKQLENEVDAVINFVRQKSQTSQYELLKSIYEYLQSNVTYDEQELDNCGKRGLSRTPMAHNAYGALVKKSAVCDGISSAFSLIAKRLGIECMVVSGKSAFRTTGFNEHAWNIIKINNKYYHIDATWDINKFSELKEYAYDYFCLEDDEIIIDHDWDIKTTPACTHSDLSYYFKNNIYANNMAQISNIILNYI